MRDLWTLREMAGYPDLVDECVHYYAQGVPEMNIGVVGVW